MKIEHLLRGSSKTVGNSLEDKMILARNNALKSILNYAENEEHRFETVTKFSGVTFINDAKSASVNSVYYALNRLKNPTVWITSGDENTGNYLSIKELVIEKVKAIVCLDDMLNIKQAFGSHVTEIYSRKDLYEAVSTAFYASEPNDIVLFSPACPADKIFGDYKKRGDLFKHAVAQL